MTFPEDEVRELSRLFPGTEQSDEGGTPYFLLPQLLLPSGRSPERIDALFCPKGRDGYPSRLFFAETIASPVARNWNGVRILERNWYAVSWRVREGLRLAQAVRAHLDALR
jgi:hypothetical protein